MSRASEILETVYNIGTGGLTPVRSDIMLQANTEYFMGASSSPSHIVVTRYDNDRIWYLQYPYTKEHVISRPIGLDLMIKGCNTWLNTYSKYQPKLAQSIKNLLAGKKGDTVDIKDFKVIRIVAIPSDPNVNPESLWRDAEEYGGVGMGKYEKYDNVFLIDSDIGRAKEMQKDKKFKVIKIIDRKD